MAETDLTPEEAAADTRLTLYNVGDYDPVSNPYGFDNDGHQVNQMPQARDAGLMGRLARRLALFTQGLANTVAANVLLTAEDAENTRLDRIATAENVGLAADEVGKAAAQANRSRDEADRAQGFAAGVNLPPITIADALKFLRAKADRSGFELAEVDLYSAALMRPVSRSSNTQIVKADKGKLFVLTGTFTQTVVSPADLGDGHHYRVKNAGTGNITIPSSDGRTNWIMYPGEMRLFYCDGTALRSEVLNPFYFVATTSGTFVPPPGYLAFEGLLWGGGGGKAGGGGACHPIALILSASLPSSVPVTIGAGVISGTGGSSSFGSITSFGGGSGSTFGGGGGGITGPGVSNGGGGGSPIPGAGNLNSSGPGGASVYGGGGGGGFGGASIYGGGGGSGNGSSGTTGGSSIYGGGGGSAGSSSSAGGTSVHGGNGGNSGQPGQAPGGGGGVNASGARGELRLWGVV